MRKFTYGVISTPLQTYNAIDYRVIVSNITPDIMRQIGNALTLFVRILRGKGAPSSTLHGRKTYKLFYPPCGLFHVARAKGYSLLTFFLPFAPEQMTAETSSAITAWK